MAMPWALAESALSALVSFVTTLIAVRLMAPAEFGLASIAIAIIAIVQALLISGIAAAIIRTPQLDTRTSDALFWSVVTMGAFACLAGLGLAAPTAVIFEDERIFWLMTVQSVTSIFLAIETVPAALLSRKMRTRSLALRTFGQKVATLVVTATVAFMGMGAWALVLGSVAGTAAGACILLLTQARLPRLTRDWRAAYPTIRLGFTVGMETFAGALTPRLLLLTFGHVQSIEALGYLNFGIRLVDEIANVLNTTITRVALPFFSSLRRTGYDERRAFVRGTHVVTLVASPVLVGLVAVGPVAVPVLFGEHWIPAVSALQIVCVVWLIRFTRVLSPVVLLSRGVAIPQLINSWVALAVGLSATLVLGQMKYEIAIFSYLTPSLVTAPLGIYMLSRASTVTVGDQLLPPTLPLIFAMSMLIAVTALSRLVGAQITTPILLVVDVLVGALTYGILALIFDRSRVREVVRMVLNR